MFFTEAASVIGKHSDNVSLIIVLICLALLCMVVALMLFFSFRYKAVRHPEAAPIEGSFVLETGWTLGAVAIVLVMFALGWGVYAAVKGGPSGAYEITARGRQWHWSFEYPDGRTSDELRLVVGRPVKLSLVSDDVIHSLYVPAFRLKQDAVPGTINSIWFTPDRKGTYELFCTEYCGYGHSHMLTKAVVMDEKEFAAWGAEKKPAGGEGGLAARGAELAKSRGCVGCHTIDGSPLVGPTWKGLFGHRVAVLTDGTKREVTADEAYIKRSIKEPGADVVEGFAPIMPDLGLSDDEIEAVVAYIKTLR